MGGRERWKYRIAVAIPGTIGSDIGGIGGGSTVLIVRF